MRCRTGTAFLSFLHSAKLTTLSMTTMTRSPVAIAAIIFVISQPMWRPRCIRLARTRNLALSLCLSLAWLRLAVLVLSCCCCCVAVAVAHKLPNKGRHMWTEEAITSAVGYANRLSLDFRIGFNGNQRMLTNCSSPRWSKRCKIGATLPGGVWRRPGVDSATAATTRRVASQCVASCNIWQRWQRMLTAF